MEYSKTLKIEKIGVLNIENLSILLKESLSLFCGISWDLHKCNIYCSKLDNQNHVKVIEHNNYIITLHNRGFERFIEVDFKIVYPENSYLAFFNFV